jgi:hypothetical protein
MKTIFGKEAKDASRILDRLQLLFPRSALSFRTPFAGTNNLKCGLMTLYWVFYLYKYYS